MTKSQGVWKHEDAALILIDYQKEMFDTVRSETPAELIDLNVRLLIKAAKAFDMPVVLSTVGVEMGVNHPTRQSILDELPGIKVIDRSSMNAWEDQPFREAVKKTGRKRLIFGALYTEICLASRRRRAGRRVRRDVRRRRRGRAFAARAPDGDRASRACRRRAEHIARDRH